jgi:hypothetical protein
MELKLEKAQDDFINVTYFHQQYHFPHCWETVEQAIMEYGKIK